jgi:hypothetical protein
LSPPPSPSASHQRGGGGNRSEIARLHWPDQPGGGKPFNFYIVYKCQTFSFVFLLCASCYIEVGCISLILFLSHNANFLLDENSFCRKNVFLQSMPSIFKVANSTWYWYMTCLQRLHYRKKLRERRHILYISLLKLYKQYSTFFCETRYNQRHLHIRAHTHPYECIHTHPIPMSTSERLCWRTNPTGLEINDIITVVSLSMGTSPPLKNIPFFYETPKC